MDGQVGSKGVLSFLPSDSGDIAVASYSSEFQVPASGDRGHLMWLAPYSRLDLFLFNTSHLENRFRHAIVLRNHIAL